LIGDSVRIFAALPFFTNFSESPKYHGLFPNPFCILRYNAGRQKQRIGQLQLPQISFIIPAKNEAQYICGCISSIVQTVDKKTPYEIIVVDNNSSDRTVELANSFGATVVNNPAKGISRSRNIGSEKSCGAYLAFIDADCILSPAWYDVVQSHMIDKSIVAVGIRIAPDPKSATWVEKTVCRMNQRRGREIAPNILEVKWVGTSNLVVRREIFERVGGFDTSLQVAEDYDLCEKINKYGNIIQDARIKTMHLRDSKTLGDLFRREIWRGRNSLSHWAASGFAWYEMPSIVAPFLFLSLTCAFFLTLTISFKWAFLIAGIAIALPILMILRLKKKLNGMKANLQGFTVASTYLVARGVALVLELIKIGIRRKSKT
jgi:glycosyltransferase involved in cell wall biosynthesis